MMVPKCHGPEGMAFGDAMRSVATFFLLTLLPLVLLGAEPTSSAGEDPIAGTIRLLENDISEEIVLEWVEAQGGVRGALSSSDVIRLRGAGATDTLLSALLRDAEVFQEMDQEDVSASETLQSGEIPPVPRTSSSGRDISQDSLSSESKREEMSPTVARGIARGDEVTVTSILRNSIRR